MGEATAENSSTTSVSRAWRVSARWLKDIETTHPVPLVVMKLEDANFGLVGVLEFGCEIAPAVGTGGCGPSRQKNAHDLKERMKSRHSEF